MRQPAVPPVTVGTAQHSDELCTHLDVKGPLQKVAVHFYLVLAAILGHLYPLVQELDPDIVRLDVRRAGGENHVLRGSEGVSVFILVFSKESEPGGAGVIPGHQHLLQEDQHLAWAGGQQPVPALHNVQHSIRSEFTGAEAIVNQSRLGRRADPPASRFTINPVTFQMES